MPEFFLFFLHTSALAAHVSISTNDMLKLLFSLSDFIVVSSFFSSLCYILICLTLTDPVSYLYSYCLCYTTFGKVKTTAENL